MRFDAEDLKHLGEMECRITGKITAESATLHARINEVERKVEHGVGSDMAQDVRLKALERNLESHVEQNGKAHSIELLHQRAVQNAADQVASHEHGYHSLKSFAKLLGVVAGMIVSVGAIWAFLSGAFGPK